MARSKTWRAAPVDERHAASATLLSKTTTEYAGSALEFRSRDEAVEASAGREFPVAGPTRLGHLPAMTIEQLKSEAAKLPPNDRFALAEWIEQTDDVRALRREELIREIQHGIGQAERGELIESDEVFARLRAGHRASV